MSREPSQETLPQACRGGNLDYFALMIKAMLVLLVAVTLVVAMSGCKSSGSREFIPGKGWVPND
jgi:hypothetical protein